MNRKLRHPPARRGQPTRRGLIARRPAHEPSIASLAALTASIAPAVLHGVVKQHKRLGPALAAALEGQGRTTAADRASISCALGALLRWWGWIEPLHLPRIEEQLLLAWLLDSAGLSALAQVWAARVGRPLDRLVPVGDAPSWTARAEGLKRWMAGRPVNADPWRLFPAWLRDQLPIPPGAATPKLRRLDFLAALQTRPPLWIGVRSTEEKAVWTALRDGGLKPWIHRRMPSAAKLPPETNLNLFEAFRTGRLVAQDIASQAVAVACDPDRGDRWWDVNGEGGLHAWHLAALMGGKGVVVCTFDQARRRHQTAVWLRRGEFHNITTRLWEGRRVSGKPGSYDGVLVDAVCSGIGVWRRHPDARWTISAAQIPALVARQLQLLNTASTGVRPGGTLIYSVATVTRSETVDVLDAFLRSCPEFRAEAFPHPLEDGTAGGSLQLWPQIHDGEARFIARMVRSSRPNAADPVQTQMNTEDLASAEQASGLAENRRSES
jgi:16S rRNA (cytosine967-C5)-methyltransferase